MNLYALFHARFESQGARVFLRCPAGAEYSFNDLHDLSARYAGALTRSGAVLGEVVAVQVEKSVAAVALYLACLRCGAVYLPLNPAFTDHERDALLDAAKARVFVHAPLYDGAVTSTGTACCLSLHKDGTGSLDALAATMPGRQEPVARAADDIVALLYTSGTTGEPKGVELSAGNLASNALALHQAWGFRAGDVLLHALPIFHVHGLFVALHCALLNASTVLFLDRFSVEHVRKALPEATVMMGVPTYYTRLLAQDDFGRRECAHMRLFVSGSAPLASTTFERFEQRTGHQVLERYGMTETGMIASNPLAGKRVPGSVGYALPAVELRVCAADGGILPAESIGEVEVRGPGVFRGYRNRPEATQASFREGGWFRTGDLGELSPAGRLRLAGRSKDLIIAGGFNIYPQEVEEVINSLPGIEECAVIGLPQADLGEVVVAVVVSDSRHAVENICLRLADRLARYKIPRGVFRVDALPRNAMGKVQKAALRARFSSPSEGAIEQVHPC